MAKKIHERQAVNKESEIVSSEEYNIREIPLVWLITEYIKKIMTISCNEFHKSIILYGDGGLVRGYLPDVLESYKNAIENFKDFLSPYHDDNIKKFLNSDPSIYEDDKDYYSTMFKFCLLLVKDLGLLPSERKDIVEIIDPTKDPKEDLEKRRSLEKEGLSNK